MTLHEWLRFGRKIPGFLREVFKNEQRPSLRMDLDRDKKTGRAVITLNVPQGKGIAPIVAEFDTAAEALICWDTYRPQLKRALGLKDARIIERVNGQALDRKQRLRILKPGMRVIG